MMQFKVVATFSNGRISEHEYSTLFEARECALNFEAYSFATVVVFENKNWGK